MLTLSFRASFGKVKEKFSFKSQNKYNLDRDSILDKHNDQVPIDAAVHENSGNITARVKFDHDWDINALDLINHMHKSLPPSRRKKHDNHKANTERSKSVNNLSSLDDSGRKRFSYSTNDLLSIDSHREHSIRSESYDRKAYIKQPQFSKSKVHFDLIGNEKVYEHKNGKTTDAQFTSEFHRSDQRPFLAPTKRHFNSLNRANSLKGLTKNSETKKVLTEDHEKQNQKESQNDLLTKSQKNIKSLKSSETSYKKHSSKYEIYIYKTLRHEIEEKSRKPEVKDDEMFIRNGQVRVSVQTRHIYLNSEKLAVVANKKTNLIHHGSMNVGHLLEHHQITNQKIKNYKKRKDSRKLICYSNPEKIGKRTSQKLEIILECSHKDPDGKGTESDAGRNFFPKDDDAEEREDHDMRTPALKRTSQTSSMRNYSSYNHFSQINTTNKHGIFNESQSLDRKEIKSKSRRKRKSTDNSKLLLHDEKFPPNPRFSTHYINHTLLEKQAHVTKELEERIEQAASRKVSLRYPLFDNTHL